MSLKRITTDIAKLVLNDYKVDHSDDATEIIVKFYGPKDSPYETGIWDIRVGFSKDYPYKSPSISFIQRIYHPNICESSGAVCLDVINQTWTPMYDLYNIFDIFLPQLLMYPNESDPLNPDAASVKISNPTLYNKYVKQYIEEYCLFDDYSIDSVSDNESELSDLSI